ncbi:queuosine precursor transporter [Flavobacterium gawalongense]|uniref:Probable queuosine precursor transporter n=1 Tax=Flavobacterium gawalongense TaxID=2594432 RepID=A0A553BX63_9FLAO|nr:queuosine precursor transporter [Flavobacterium gawalongense]TRX04163.1 queuosine precursor transporter [Flavobacterium gawalongense]TRX09387.1 queuosine precursor transporter [Flavobacterium gawalongense]TRX12799.1 queuosine precursor transporter [Flavobacterium gawalongense]TRX13144.1 queuosine precursor transporter [Flavobacterium gawalongense]TRX30794.1 queuosine precursor transporter [Flavobacterium gawalongense]
MFRSKKDIVFIILAGIFITNAVVAELIGGKLIYVGPYLMSIGILPWPIVFVTTDLINEYFGEKGVKKLSLITASLIAYCFILLFFALKIPAVKGTNLVTDAQFNGVFGQSMWIIVGSITAFLVSQLIDVSIFHFFKNKTGNKMIWLRSTGSTVISQLFDSFIVLGIAFWMTGKMTAEVYIASAFTGYFVKLIIAILLTPLIYLGHSLIEKYIHNK